MKQLYFTFCCNGQSLSGNGGDRARAASAGISDSEAERFKGACSYSLNVQELLRSGMSREQLVEAAPESLKFSKLDKRSILVHVSDAEPDRQTRREGNYFAHVLIDLPPDWTQQDALALWKSPFWVTKDSDEIPVCLPEADPLDIPPGIINEQSFTDFLNPQSPNQNPNSVELFCFLLQSWFTLFVAQNGSNESNRQTGANSSIRPNGQTTNPGTVAHPGATANPGTATYSSAAANPGTAAYPGAAANPGTVAHPGAAANKSQSGKIVLICSPEQAAFCLWGLTRCLPPELWKDRLTFSTYEKPTLLLTKAVTAFSSLSDFCPQDETVFRLLTNQPDCRIYRESADGAQTLALSATPQPQNRPLAPFLTDLVEYCRLGRFDDFLTFYQQVPLRFRTNLNALQLFWNFANRQDRLQLPQIAAALRIEELKSAAISQLLQTDRFTFQEQLSLYSALPKPEQDELVNRILREYSIQQIRQEPRLRDILLGALAIETGLKSDGDTLPAAQTPEDGKPTSPISPTFLPLRGLNGVVKRISSLFFPKPATNQQPAKKMNPEKRNPS